MYTENKGIEIVLIEDNSHDVEIFLNVIQWIDMDDNVKVFSDGREALDYLLGKGKYEKNSLANPGVIFLDLKMPLIDGNEVLRLLRADDRTTRIPVVVMTSSSP